VQTKVLHKIKIDIYYVAENLTHKYNLAATERYVAVTDNRLPMYPNV